MDQLETGELWTLYPSGLIAIVRTPDAPEDARFLMGRLAFCGDAQCDCRTATVRFTETDAPTAEAGTSEWLSKALATGTGFEALIDIDFGVVRPPTEVGAVPLPADWLGVVEQSIDGHLLDVLQQRWGEAKGFHAHPPDFATYRQEPTRMVGWHFTQPHLRDDSYLLGERRFLADELYCLAPGCDCDETVVDFIELLGDDDSRGIGGVRLHARDWAEMGRVVEPAEAELLSTLWGEFRRRHVDRERLWSHREHLRRALAASNAARPSAKARVGRNEPCPCGSGQKYKRCCMDKDLAAPS